MHYNVDRLNKTMIKLLNKSYYTYINIKNISKYTVCTYTKPLKILYNCNRVKFLQF